MLFYFIKHFINEDHLSFWYFLSLFDETVENQNTFPFGDTKESNLLSSANS